MYRREKMELLEFAVATVVLTCWRVMFEKRFHGIRSVGALTGCQSRLRTGIRGQSHLNESIGLTFAPRTAGPQLAAKATLADRIDTLASVSMSKGVMP
jgi:hypothetical protein